MIEKISPIPIHVGIIMDGNGRWAINRNLPRIEGHREGVKTVRKITKASAEIGISYLSLFAFSTENWKRDKSEVEFLFNLFIETIDNYLPELKENNVKLNFIGNIEGLPFFLRKAIDYAKKATINGSKMILNIALNYGARNEIIEACKQICKSKVEINEESFKEFLYTKGQPDPDVIIRTSGERRLSNFLLYQASYSELFFTETLWPDFSEEEYIQILKEYGNRKRRFGGI